MITYKQPKNAEQAIMEMHLLVSKIAYFEDLHRNRFDLKFKLLVFKCIAEISDKGSLSDGLREELRKEAKYYEEYYKNPSSISASNSGNTVPV